MSMIIEIKDRVGWLLLSIALYERIDVVGEDRHVDIWREESNLMKHDFIWTKSCVSVKKYK